MLNALLAVPATRTNREIPTEVVLDTGDGMPEACALSLDNLTSVPKELFRVRITRLSVERMSDVCSALALASGAARSRTPSGAPAGLKAQGQGQTRPKERLARSAPES